MTGIPHPGHTRHPSFACRLETPAGIVYINVKFLVGTTKSGSTRSRSFLLPAGRSDKATGIR
ncbi:hypothetical protein MPLB_250060 [Mesorhizobium sp. ORS 3324]|nr:hypothetical protein MPLB_250060 [Mesorhizobium sp. ORS 3324]